jgi:hypothetical protein
MTFPCRGRASVGHPTGQRTRRAWPGTAPSRAYGKVHVSGGDHKLSYAQVVGLIPTGGSFTWANYFDLKKSAWRRRVLDLVEEDGLDPLG